MYIAKIDDSIWDSADNFFVKGGTFDQIGVGSFVIQLTIVICFTSEMGL